MFDEVNLSNTKRVLNKLKKADIIDFDGVLLSRLKNSESHLGLVKFLKSKNSNIFKEFEDSGRPAWWFLDDWFLLNKKYPLDKEIFLSHSKSGEPYPFFILASGPHYRHHINLNQFLTNPLMEEYQMDFDFVDDMGENIFHKLFKKNSSFYETFCKAYFINLFQNNLGLKDEKLKFLLNSGSKDGETPIDHLISSKGHLPSEKFLLPQIIPHIDFYKTGKFDEDLVCKLDNIAQRTECEEASILLEGIVLRSLAPQKTSKTKSYLKI